MTSTESRSAVGSHLVGADAMTPPAAAPERYALRRRTDPREQATSEFSFAPGHTFPPSASHPPVAGAYSPPPAAEFPVPSYQDYVHPDYAMQWQRKQSHAGRVVALLLAVLLVAGGGYWWYFHMRVTGVPYRSDAGHFSARFPHKPQAEDQAVRTSNGYPMHEVLASDDRGKTAAGMIAFDSLPAVVADGSGDLELQMGMVGAAQSAHLTSTSEKATKFHGKAARIGQFTDESGETVTMMIIKYDATRFYMLLAEPGRHFDNLERSFKMLP